LGSAGVFITKPLLCAIVVHFSRTNMTELTQQLKKLLTDEINSSSVDFKKLAMNLARDGADITQGADSGARDTLLHILVRTNKDGNNSAEISELVGLNRNVLMSKDKYARTALQSLLDALYYDECTAKDFEDSAMLLAQLGTDITLSSTSGSHSTLLHVLAGTNKAGAHTAKITELVRLNHDVLAGKDKYTRTALQALLDALHHDECSLEDFKLSVMALAQLGADITLGSTSGSNPTLLHELTGKNRDGVHNAEIAILVGLNPNILASQDKYGRTALQSLLDEFYHEKCSLEDFKQSAMVLAKLGADITLGSTSGEHPTLLHVLVRTNRAGANKVEIADLVGLNDEILATKDKYGCTALQSLLDALCSDECSLEDLKPSAMALAKLGADITLGSTLNSKSTLLHVLACTNEDGANDDDIVALVKLNPFSISTKDRNGRTPLQSLLDELYYKHISFQNFKQSAMLLAKQGSDLSLEGSIGKRGTLLHVLVRNLDDSYHEIAELIELDNDVLNYTDYKGRTPIHSLLSKNKHATTEVIEKLLSPTNLHLQDKQNATLLHAACESGNQTAVEYLVGKGLSLTALTNKNETLLHFHAASRNTTLTQWLIDTKQIDINAKDIYGETALHYATRENNPRMIELLIRNGAYLSIRNDEGFRPSDLASKLGFKHLVPYLSDPKVEFFQRIQIMQDYGVSLKAQGASKGQVAMDLATNLTIMANEYFEKAPEQRNFSEFEPRFSKLLHSKDAEMSAYRASWGTIVANIAIALTVIGAFFIAAKLIYSRITEGRALFFFQKSKTTTEDKLADIEDAASMVATCA
jgi:ankyrin repeat protein